jgi:hypothetical protein
VTVVRSGLSGELKGLPLVASTLHSLDVCKACFWLPLDFDR